MSRVFDKDGKDVSFAYVTVIKALKEWHEAHRADHIATGYESRDFDGLYEKHAHTGAKYMRLDVGGSGAWMMEIGTGDIYGIKGYGKVDKAKCAGNMYDVDFNGAVLFRDRFRYGRFDNRGVAVSKPGEMGSKDWKEGSIL